MQRSGPGNQAARWQALVRFDKAKIAPEIAIRNTVGIVLPLIAGAALGNLSAGAVGALGALNVSFRDSRDPYFERARRLLLASLLVGVAVSLGAISGQSRAVAVAVAMLWAFGTGMMVLFGLQAGNLGVTTLVTLLVFAARPLTPVEAVETGLVAAAGGVLQTLLSIAFWPVDRYEPERAIIGSLYHALAALAVSPAGSGGAPPATVELAEMQKVLSSLSQDRNIEAERLIFLANQAERVRLSLLTLRRLFHRIGRDPGGSAAAAVMERILAAASAALEETSRAVADGHMVSLDQFGDSVERLRQFDWKGQSSFLDALIRDAGHHANALAGQLRSARALVHHAGQLPKRGASSPQAPERTLRFAVLRANLSWQSAAFRHAVRLAVCVGVGESLGHSLHFQRTYWLTMTIAIVLRPDFSATFHRGILRIAGTMAGLVLATGLFRFPHSGETAEIVLLAVFAFLLRWIGPANYGIFVTAISALIVLLLAITGVNPAEAIEARAVNTVIGGAIALAAYSLWPTLERSRAWLVFANLMEAYENYFHAVIEAYATPVKSDGDRNRTRTKARLARSNAEALVDRVAAEPGITSDLSNLLSGILASAHNFIRAVMALESGLYLNRPDRLRPATLEFALAVEATLGAVAATFRSSNPLTRLPDLRAAHNAILASAEAPTEQYTLINTETDRITTSLNTLAEQTVKWRSSMLV